MRAEETKISLLYNMLQTATIRGIGNCTQACNHVADFLSTGAMPVAVWSNSLPSINTNRNINNVVSDVYEYNRPGDTEKSETKKLLHVLNGLLKEGQHVQVRGNMQGRVYQTLMIGHVFNAIKIDGKVKLIDCYQGISSEPWLKQAWNDPEVFLSYFSNFAISNPEESRIIPVMAEFLERKISNSNLPPLVQDRLVSGVRTQFGFFNTKENSQRPESELVEKTDSSFKADSK